MARIVINPSTFKNQKDALCVAFNERFRIAMEQYGWEPQSEPTAQQRRENNMNDKELDRIEAEARAEAYKPAVERIIEAKAQPEEAK